MSASGPQSVVVVVVVVSVVVVVVVVGVVVVVVVGVVVVVVGVVVAVAVVTGVVFIFAMRASRLVTRYGHPVPGEVDTLTATSNPAEKSREKK